MNDIASILTIGSELLDGRTVDTNSQFLISELSALGFKIQTIACCDDEIDEICRSLEHISKGSSLVLITGGLGPTTDDLTRESLAKFSKQELSLSNEALSQIELFLKNKGRTLTESNKKQAFLPQSAKFIKNSVGTAPGFFLKHDQTIFISMPGVPRELKSMFSSEVKSILEDKFDLDSQLQRKTLRVFGLPEASIQDRVSPLNLSQETLVSYRAHFPEIQVTLKAPQSAETFGEDINKVKESIGQDCIFSESLDFSFEQSLHELLLKSSKTISVAESCTAGMIGGRLATCPDSSKYLLGGAITYSNEMKQRVLGVSPLTLEEFGAVSHETVKEMAEGARKNFNSDISVSVSGIAGPGGGSEQKPVGTFYVGLCANNKTITYKQFFKSTRTGVRTLACYLCLDTIRRYLLNYPQSSVEERVFDFK